MVFKEHFDEALKKCNDWKFKQRSPIKERYSPSDLGFNCKRFLFFGFVNAPSEETFSDETNRTLEVGNQIHSMFQHFSEKWADRIHIKSEHYFQTPLTKDDPKIIFSGSIDDIHMYPNVGMVIMEYKSINGFAIKYLNGKPKPEHIAQIQMYMHYTGIHKGIVVYFDKNASDIQEYKVKYDPEEVNKWIEFIKDTQYNYVDKLELPPIPETHSKSSFPCSYCKYKGICYEDKEWKSEYYKDLVNKRNKELEETKWSLSEDVKEDKAVDIDKEIEDYSSGDVEIPKGSGFSIDEIDENELDAFERENL